MNNLYCIASVVRCLSFTSIAFLLLVFVYFILPDHGARITYVSLARLDDTMIPSRTSLLSGTSGKINDNDNYTGKGKQVSVEML